MGTVSPTSNREPGRGETMEIPCSGAVASAAEQATVAQSATVKPVILQVFMVFETPQ